MLLSGYVHNSRSVEESHTSSPRSSLLLPPHSVNALLILLIVRIFVRFPVIWVGLADDHFVCAPETASREGEEDVKLPYFWLLQEPFSAKSAGLGWCSAFAYRELVDVRIPSRAPSPVSRGNLHSRHSMIGRGSDGDP